MATKAQLLGIINTQLASNQPILASQHRTQIITMLDELYNAQSRGNVLAELPLTSLQLANDAFLAFRDGAALQIPFSSIFDDPLTLGTPNGLELDGTVLSLGLASANTTGALSDADFNIFNAKQDAGNFVTIDTDQTITGIKTFGNNALQVASGGSGSFPTVIRNITINSLTSGGFNHLGFNNLNNIYFSKGSGSFNAGVFAFNNTGTRTYTLQDASGTLALTSDLHAAATLGTANGLSLAGQVLSLGVASASATGALSAANFNIFNTKVGGSGTTNFLSKFTGSGTIGNSAVFENNGNVGIGTTAPSGLQKTLNIDGGSMGASLAIDGGDNFAVMFVGATVNDPTSMYSNTGFKFATATAKDATDFTIHLRITSAGDVRIANLAGAGSRTVTADASGNLSASSDSSLKQEDTTHKIEGLAEILQLQPKAYKWLSDIEIRGEEAATEIGFFADEVNAIIPSAAPKGNDDLYGFYDRAVIAALVKAIQELKTEIDLLKNQTEIN